MTSPVAKSTWIVIKSEIAQHQRGRRRGLTAVVMLWVSNGRCVSFIWYLQCEGASQWILSQTLDAAIGILGAHHRSNDIVNVWDSVTMQAMYQLVHTSM